MTQEIQKHLRDQNGIADVKLPAETLTQWKKSVKQAKQDVLELAVAGSAASSTSVPNPFANVKTSTAKDSSARKAFPRFQTRRDVFPH